MAVSSGFFNSVSGDRTYDAEQFGDLFDGIIRDGVFMYSSYNTELPFIPKIVPETPMRITLGPGKAWFMRTWTISTIAEPFTFAVGEGYGRYDAVVLNVDKRQVNRRNTFSVVKGEARPTPVWPTLANEANYRQYPLVYVYIPAGATSLTNSSIDYHVGKTPLDVPFVTGPLEILDPSALFASWQATWEEWYLPFKANAISDWSTFLADKLSEFNAFVQARQNEFNAFMAVSKTTFDDFMTDSGNTFDEWMAERDIMFYSWFNQVQIDWQTWFDSIKADWQTWFDDNASQFDSWWKGAEDAFNTWLAGMQGVISGTEYTELANAISDVNPLFTATSSVVDGVTYVDVVVPQGGTEMYKNIKKTPTNTQYPFYFVSPVRFSVDQVYRFTDAINGIDKQVMTIRTPDRYPLMSDNIWDVNGVVSLYRNGSDFFFTGYKKPDGCLVNIEGTSPVSGYIKLIEVDVAANSSNADLFIDFVAGTTYGPNTTGNITAQSFGQLHLRANTTGQLVTAMNWMKIVVGDNMFDDAALGTFYPIITDNTGNGNTHFEIWGKVTQGYVGIYLTELSKSARFDNPSSAIVNAYKFRYIRASVLKENTTPELPEGIRLNTYYNAVSQGALDGKVDKLLPPEAETESRKYFYQVTPSGQEQKQLLATTSPSLSNPSLVMRNAGGMFSVNAARSNDQPVNLAQATSMIEAGLAVEEFWRTKSRVIGAWAQPSGTRYWTAPIRINSIAPQSGGTGVSETLDVVFQLQGTYQSGVPSTAGGGNVSGLIGWTAQFAASVRFDAGYVINGSRCAIKCIFSTAPSYVFEPTTDICFTYHNGDAFALVLVKSPGDSSASFSSMIMTIISESSDNPSVSNARSEQIVTWYLPNTNVTTTDPTGNWVEKGLHYEAQALMAAGWNGWRGKNYHRPWNKLFFKTPDRQVLGGNGAWTWHMNIARNGIRNGQATCMVFIRVDTPPTSFTGYVIDRVSAPFDAGYSQGAKAMLIPQGWSDDNPGWINPHGESVYLGNGRIQIGGNTYGYGEGHIGDPTNGTDIVYYLSTVNNVVVQIEVAISPGTIVGETAVYEFPIDTWGDLGLLYGLSVPNHT